MCTPRCEQQLDTGHYKSYPRTSTKTNRTRRVQKEKQGFTVTVQFMSAGLTSLSRLWFVLHLPSSYKYMKNYVLSMPVSGKSASSEFK